MDLDTLGHINWPSPCYPLTDVRLHRPRGEDGDPRRTDPLHPLHHHGHRQGRGRRQLGPTGRRHRGRQHGSEGHHWPAEERQGGGGHGRHEGRPGQSLTQWAQHGQRLQGAARARQYGESAQQWSCFYWREGNYFHGLYFPRIIRFTHVSVEVICRCMVGIWATQRIFVRKICEIYFLKDWQLW